MSVFWSDDLVTVHHAEHKPGRGLAIDLPDASVDAIVTDPPYELGFMGKTWDGSGIAYDEDLWADCLRALKPGGHLLAFGGSRTWHRLVCAVEDAGFEIRDGIMWVYASGFPKSLDVSKAIDKAAGAEREVVGEGQPFGRGAMGNRSRVAVGYRPTEINPDGGVSLVTAPATPDAARWQGWGTALKPAFEPICVARKPLAGTVAATVLAHGTGALNLDACRVSMSEADREATAARNRHATWGSGARANKVYGADGRTRAESGDWTGEKGRWPSNVVLTHAPACTDDGVCVDGCPVAEMDAQSGVTKDGVAVNRNRGETRPMTVAGTPSRVLHEDQGYGGSGGASRFFPVFRYQAKADGSERPKHGGTAHPTVKPLDLMRWLVRLVTPPAGLVLEPFAGSGTTVEACLVEGFRCVAVERDAEYLPLIVDRITRRTDPVAHLAHQRAGGADVDLGLFEFLDGGAA